MFYLLIVLPNAKPRPVVNLNLNPKPKLKNVLFLLTNGQMLPEALAKEVEARCEPPAIPRKISRAVPTASSGPSQEPRVRLATPTIRSVPTSTPELTSTPEPETKDLSFFEHCVECGASFNVDRLEISEKKFRIRVNIENTGEVGILQLVLMMWGWGKNKSILDILRVLRIWFLDRVKVGGVV